MIIKLTSLSSVRTPTKPRHYLVAVAAVDGDAALCFPEVKAGADTVLYAGLGEVGAGAYVRASLMGTDRDATRAEQLISASPQAPLVLGEVARLRLADAVDNAVARLCAVGDQLLGEFELPLVGDGPWEIKTDSVTGTIEVSAGEVAPDREPVGANAGTKEGGAKPRGPRAQFASGPASTPAAGDTATAPTEGAGGATDR